MHIINECIFVLILYKTKDYRQDARDYLLNVAGKTEDEIDRHYIPKTMAEKRQSAVQQVEKAVQLEEQVAILQRQVDQLQWKVFGTNLTTDGELTNRNSNGKM